jgi:hypothetical protein
MTTQKYFENLLDKINLKLGDEERNFIEEKQNALREKLRGKLSLQDDFLTGSYKRHTIIKPENEDEKFDVDVFVAFDKEEYGDSKLADLRQVVVDALHEIKSEDGDLGITAINEDQRRSVGIEFGNNFQIDIVPAVQIEKDKLYKIFDRRTLEAVKSNPKLHGELLSKANEDAGGLLVPLIKILKAWKREKCDYVKSFHVELMAIKIFNGTTIENLSKGLLTFFEAAGNYFSKACLKDPANIEMLIDEYLDQDSTREQICTLVEAEKTVAKAAVEAEEGGNDNEAVREWGKIFADSDAETAKAVREGNFYAGAGGAVVKTNTSQHDANRINSPRSWRQ